jgi:hypothetical protein
MATDRRSLLAVPAAAALLLWPALWNGFPIVFADTGTYLSQAIHRYAGWDRPVFYSLFMLPLHLTVTVWPVVVVQALLAAWVLWLVCRTLVPRISGIAFVGGVGLLSVCTWLPWLVSELMPDLFTPLLVLVLCLLAWVSERLSSTERLALAGLATFMIASQQSSVPLTGVLLAAILACDRALSVRRGPTRTRPQGVSAIPDRDERPASRRRRLLLVIPAVLAVFGLCVVNLAAHGRFTISPFGDIFLLSRVIYDGPGMAVLRDDCPTANWRLCPFLDSFPPTSDDFLWSHESPLNRAGGAKPVSEEAGAIIRAVLLADPVGEARAALANTLEQMTRFASGDGLNPWPAQVSPTIDRDFPARERAAYASARQQTGSLSVLPLLAQIHRIGALSGALSCVILLPVAFRRRATCTGFLLAVLLALPVSAAITGSLSAPHDRYQARVMWLTPFIAVISLASLRRRPA